MRLEVEGLLRSPPQMDEEERWTQKIAARESLAFIPYAQRMWNYALVNGLYPADAKQLKRDYGKTLSYGTLSGIFAVLYWNTYAMSTSHSFLSNLNFIDEHGRPTFASIAPNTPSSVLCFLNAHAV